MGKKKSAIEIAIASDGFRRFPTHVDRLDGWYARPSLGLGLGDTEHVLFIDGKEKATVTDASSRYGTTRIHISYEADRTPDVPTLEKAKAYAEEYLEVMATLAKKYAPKKTN